MKTKYIEHPYESELNQLYKAACAYIKVEIAHSVPGFGWTLGKGRRHQVGAYIAETPQGQYWLLPQFSINQPCFIRVCGPIDKEQKGYLMMTSLILHERGKMLGTQEPLDTLPSMYDGVQINIENVPVPDLVKKPDLAAFKHYWNKVEAQRALLKNDRELKEAKAARLARSRSIFRK